MARSLRLLALSLIATHAMAAGAEAISIDIRQAVYVPTGAETFLFRHAQVDQAGDFDAQFQWNRQTLVFEPVTAAPSNPLWKNYVQAVADASDPRPDRVVTTLPTVTPGSGDFAWNTIDGETYALFVSWVRNDSYFRDPAGRPFPYTYGTGPYDIWVTGTTDLLSHCRAAGFGGNNLTARLEQLLGLPPDAGEVSFVEFWVRPSDLFRPCPDEEVTDHQCQLAMPENVTPSHRMWFNGQRAVKYAPQGGTAYPWTQLGYTYDWANPQAPYGLAEYVIRRNATVYVNAITPTMEYCGNGTLQ